MTTLNEYTAVFATRRFPPGHLIQACAGVEQRARAHALGDLVRRTHVGREHAMRYIALKARRRAQKLARGGGVTREIDGRIDANFGQIHDVLVREKKSYGDTADGKLAAELLEVVFPDGLAGATQIPYEEQVALNEYQVALIREKYPEAPARLGFERPLRRIEALLPTYRGSLAVAETVSAIAVGEAYAEMQVALLRVVATIMALEDDTRRADLMTPVNDQAQRLAAAYAARRRGQAAPGDLPLDGLELDADARAALDAVAEAEAAVEAEAVEAEAEVDANAAEGSAAEGAEAAPEADGLPLRPIR